MNYINSRGYAVTMQTQYVRAIAGSGGRLSEHSFGNAIDIFGNSSVLDTVAADLNRRRSEFNVGTLCWDGGSKSYDRCTTPHIDHIHVDFKPACGRKLAGAVTKDMLGKSDVPALASACNDLQGGGTPSTPADGGGWLSDVTGGITDALTPDLPGLADLQSAGLRIGYVLGAVVLATAAIAILVSEGKTTGITKALKSVVK